MKYLLADEHVATTYVAVRSSGVATPPPGSFISVDVVGERHEHPVSAPRGRVAPSASSALTWLFGPRWALSWVNHHADLGEDCELRSPRALDPALCARLLEHQECLWRSVAEDRTRYLRLLDPGSGECVAALPAEWLYGGPSTSALPVTMLLSAVDYRLDGSLRRGVILDDGLGSGVTLVHPVLDDADGRAVLPGQAAGIDSCGTPMTVLVDPVGASTILSPALDVLWAAVDSAVTSVRHLLFYDEPEKTHGPSIETGRESY